MIIVLITVGALTAVTGIFFAIYYYYYWIPKKRPFEIAGCILTAEDNIINVGFKINRTGYIAKGPHEIYIIDETTGIKIPLLSFPNLGKMLTVKGNRGKFGYMMFANMGKVVKHEAKVTVTIGDFAKKHVAVI